MVTKLTSRLLSIRDVKSVLKTGPRDFLKGPTNAKNAIRRITAREKIKSTRKSNDKPLSRYLTFKKENPSEKPFVSPKLIENPKTFFDHINNQDALHHGSKLNRRAFLLNMINKRSHGLPTLSNESSLSNQKKVTNNRVKFVDLKKLWVNENIFPKDYDPNWRDRENLPNWLKHRYAIQERTMFQKWCPSKRVPREVMDKSPEENTPKKLSQQFKISPESIRRILHSKFVPTAEIAVRQNKKVLEKLSKFKADMKEKRKEDKRLKKLKKKKLVKDVLPSVKKPKQKGDRFLKVLRAVQNSGESSRETHV
ncbi:6987_t:CDS:2 [Scutellospora calospora]|uniref:6987_t:CDS:1 n=1 Tax=Scutellospora calospora TaxID=85575 RepID=A0ACA9LP64_9GLOM|nr:6987_t:CDS:2 [Scutellospora calospora]